MVCLQGKDFRFTLFLGSVSPRAQICLLVLNLFWRPKDSISPQDIITQEITKPEESIRIAWSVCLRGIFCSGKFEEEVIPFWPKCPALVLRLGNSAWVILIGMCHDEARTIPQHEV